MQRFICTLSLFFMLFLIFPVPVQAGGIGTYNYATPDVGLAAAGSAARAQDAGTIATNPAGMMLLGEHEMLYGIQMLHGDVAFTPGAGTTVEGNDGGQAVGWVPGGSFFYVNTVSPRVKYGIGLYSNFGNMMKYDDNWVGRYNIQQGTLLGMSLALALAYRVDEHLSIGVAANVMYGKFDSQVAVNNALDQMGDGRLNLSDSTCGLGGNIGLIYEFNPRTRIGLMYSSPVKLNFSGENQWSGLGPTIEKILAAHGLLNSQTNIDITVPQQVMLSYYHQSTDNLSVMANIGWQNWSRFGYAGISLVSKDPNTLVKNLDYDDTWHGAIGAQYRLNSRWTISSGISYDSSAVDDEHRTVTLPMGEIWQLGLGATYSISDESYVNFAYVHGWMGDMHVSESNELGSTKVEGSYNNAGYDVFSISYIKKY